MKRTECSECGEMRPVHLPGCSNDFNTYRVASGSIRGMSNKTYGEALIELEESMRQLKLETIESLGPILGLLFRLFLWIKDVWAKVWRY